MYSSLLLMAFLNTLSYSIFSQTDDSIGLLDRLDVVEFSEKVYISTDKPVYTPGDTIWFSAFVLDAQSHTFSEKSKVLHIDLHDQDNQEVDYKRLYADRGRAAGYFVLNDSLSATDFYLRAYTKYMRNGSDEFFFYKKIGIWDPKTQDLDIDLPEFADREFSSDQIDRPEVQFFPEGGTLIQGLNNRIAFKISAANNLSNVSAYLIDKDTDAMTDIRIQDNGTGLMSIIPEAVSNEKFVLKVDGVAYNYSLPTATKSGSVLSADLRGSKLIIKVKTNSVGEGQELLAHMRGDLVWNQSVTFNDENEFVRILPTDSLNTGILTLTLFDSEGLPQAERLIFINNYEPVSVLDCPATGSSEQDEVSFMLECDACQNQFFRASISAYVTEQGTSRQDNIVSYILLNSDLRGNVQGAYSYIKDASDFKKAYLLDLIMMTHGWRRFSWEIIGTSQSEMRNPFLVEEGLFIKGKTLSAQSNDKTLMSNVTLTVLDQNFSEFEQVTDEEGNFSFGPFIAFDTLDAFIQARKFKAGKERAKLEGSRNVKIQLSQDREYLKFDTSKITVLLQDDELNISESILDQRRKGQYLLDKYNDMMKVDLDAFVISAKAMTRADSIDAVQERYSVYSEPTHRLVLDESDHLGYSSVFDLLRRVPGVQVSGGFPNYSATIRGVSSLNASTEPLYLFNGMQVDVSFINTVNPGEVSFIDVLSDGRAAVYGLRGANGVIAIYADNDLNAKKRTIPGIENFKLVGFSLNKAFYTPELSELKVNDGLPDLRSTVFWLPLAQIGVQNPQEYSFISSDLKGIYRIVVEGISQTGRMLYDSCNITID